MTSRPQVKKLTSLVSSSSTAMERQTIKTERKPGSYSIASQWKCRPHVALEWDASLEKVVSIPDQVGLSWRDLSSCSKLGFYSSGLADAINVPHELLELKDLMDVLSIEAWNTCLSESEREFLTGFLPKEIDKESTVHRLLSGDNFHFGNPLMLWGTCIYTGAAHPDSLCARDRKLKNARRAYYCEMQNYHEKMLKDLSSIKELWISCNNPERSFPTKLHSWRSKRASKNAKHDSMRIVPHALAKKVENKDKNAVHGERKTAINAFKFDVGSVNINSHFRQRKRRKIGSLQESLEKAAVVSIDGSKRHMPIACNSTAVELSAEITCTIKVNHRQYAHILNLKQAGEELRFDSLSSILGSQNKLGICYLSTLDESDTQRTRKHWSKLLEGIAAASAAFLERKAHKIEAAKTFAQWCLYGQSHLMRKMTISEVDDDYRDIESANIIKLGPSQQLDMHGNTYAASSPLSPSTLTWHGEHNVTSFVCRTNLKTEICIQQQVSASDSSSTVSKISDSGAKSLTHLILNRHSPSKEQALFQHTPNISPRSIRNESPAFCQEDIPGRSIVSGLESETFLEHGIEESLGTQRGITNLVIRDSAIIADDDEVSAIKTAWPSENLEEELHSENCEMRNAKKNDGFVGVKGSTIWDLQMTPVSETSTIIPMQCSVTRSEVEQSKDLQYQCSELDSDLLGVQPMLGFSCREQPMEYQQGNSFLVNQNMLQGFYNHDSNTEEERPQEPDHPQDSSDIQYSGYQPMISITGNGISQQSESSLRQYPHNEIRSSLLHVGQKRFENQSKQQVCFSESTTESHSGFLGLCAESGAARLTSPVQALQSNVRQNSIFKNSQIPLPTLSNSERSNQSFSPLNLQVLPDGRSLEQQTCFGQSGLLHLQPQTSFLTKHEGILTHHQQHVSQQLPLYQELHHNQPHHDQNIFSSSSSILTGWQDSQQISSGAATVDSNSSSQFGPSTGHWSSRNQCFQNNWLQMQAASGHFSRAKYEEMKLPVSMSFWNQLSQSGVSAQSGVGAVDPVWQKNGQYLGGTHRAFDANPFACTGQDDWVSLRQLPSGQQYIPSADKMLLSGAQSAPWLNLPLGFHITHQLSNNQQSSLQEQSLSKNNPHLGTSFDYC